MELCSHLFAVAYRPLVDLLSPMVNQEHRLMLLHSALMSLADEAALKRLLFEGHTMVLSQLREAVANPEAAHTRKLPEVERNAKMITLRQLCLAYASRNNWSPATACWIWCRNNSRHNSWPTCHQIVALRVSGRWPWARPQSRSNWTRTTW